MPVLTEREKKLLGPLIFPFEDSSKPPEEKQPKDGETDRSAFEDFIHDAANDGRPTRRYVELTVEEIERLKAEFRNSEKCFLWVIDEMSIKLIREKTPNPARTHRQDYVCHTNLTGWGKAYAAGELFFGVDGKIYINHLSDRYGRDRLLQGNRWLTILRYFRRVGYKEIVDLVELMTAESRS
jgi:hypothetical protein